MRFSVGMVILAAVLTLGGCPPEDYPQAAPTTMDVVNDVVDDGTLTAQEKREQLGELGLSPLVINQLLRDERFGNQFGGDLRSAYEKVTNNRLLALTPDEIQIYADGATQVDDDFNTSIADSEARPISQFFEEFGILSADELEAYLDTPGNTVPDAIPDGVLRTLFVDFDPDLLLPILP